MIEIVKELGIFTIAAQTLLHFCPNKNYAKYIKIVISCMTLVILLLPVLGLFKENPQAAFQEKLNAYGKTIESIQERQNELAEYQTIDFLEETKKEIETKLSSVLSESGYKIQEMKIAGEKEERLIITLKPDRNSIQVPKDFHRVGKEYEFINAGRTYAAKENSGKIRNRRRVFGGKNL